MLRLCSEARRRQYWALEAMLVAGELVVAVWE